MSNSNSTSNGVGFFGLLFLLFLGLKLGKVINWSWWWVTAPLWGGTVVILVMVAVIFITKMIDKFLDF